MAAQLPVDRRVGRDRQVTPFGGDAFEGALVELGTRPEELDRERHASDELLAVPVADVRAGARRVAGAREGQVRGGGRQFRQAGFSPFGRDGGDGVGGGLAVSFSGAGEADLVGGRPSANLREVARQLLVLVNEAADHLDERRGPSVGALRDRQAGALLAFFPAEPVLPKEFLDLGALRDRAVDGAPRRARRLAAVISRRARS